MARGRKPSREEILTNVKNAWESGEDLRTGSVQKGEYRQLYRSSKNYFSNWKKTLQEAGISYTEVKERVKRK
ncbi:MAG: hypothetical protein OQJ88_00850, partial [Flavobacteriales bacterium]|nr:hypothetical protein [Flavobacteriales bacterium]